MQPSQGLGDASTAASTQRHASEMGKSRRLSDRAKRDGFFIFAACALAPVALAHHSYAIFDATTVLTIDGIVTDLAWMNPHFYFTLESKDPNGGESRVHRSARLRT